MSYNYPILERVSFCDKFLAAGGWAPFAASSELMRSSRLKRTSRRNVHFAKWSVERDFAGARGAKLYLAPEEAEDWGKMKACRAKTWKEVVSNGVVDHDVELEKICGLNAFMCECGAQVSFSLFGGWIHADR